VERLHLHGKAGFQVGQTAVHLSGVLVQACVHGPDHGFENFLVDGRGRGLAGRGRTGRDRRLLHPLQSAFHAVEPAG
jgi:hypothetical protein